MSMALRPALQNSVVRQTVGSWWLSKDEQASGGLECGFEHEFGGSGG
jgi:hypothetical protein